MIDDFFDDDISHDPEVNQGIKSFLDQSKSYKNINAKEYSDIVNETRKLALKEETKDVQQEKESTYSETFTDESKSCETKDAPSVSEPLPDTQTKHSDTPRKTSDSEAASAASGPQRSSGNTSDQNSDVSPATSSQKTRSKAMDDASRSDTLFDISKNLDFDEKRVLYRKDDDVYSSISEENVQGISKELPFMQKYAKLKETNDRKIAEWLQRKKREERIRRKEQDRLRREKIKLEEEEKERKEREEERKTKRVKEAVEEWHEVKNEEQRRKTRRHQQEATEAQRWRERRAADSRRAFTRWLASHPHHTRGDLTSHARTGDRPVTYYDWGRPLPPSYVNPVPWRRL